VNHKKNLYRDPGLVKQNKQKKIKNKNHFPKRKSVKIKGNSRTNRALDNKIPIPSKRKEKNKKRIIANPNHSQNPKNKNKKTNPNKTQSQNKKSPPINPPKGKRSKTSTIAIHNKRDHKRKENNSSQRKILSVIV
jgi:hypothetical protein